MIEIYWKLIILIGRIHLAYGIKVKGRLIVTCIERRIYD